MYGYCPNTVSTPDADQTHAHQVAEQYRAKKRD